MLWPGVLNQVIRDPKDVDDCWVFALQWAALAADRKARVYTKDQIRAAAGNPDDGVGDGGTLSDVERAAALWPDLRPEPYRGPAGGLLDRIRSGRTAMVAVWSGALPLYLRFGFSGAHAVGVVWDAGRATFLIANPLAPEGSAPLEIAEAALATAMSDRRLATGGAAWGVTFEISTEVDMATIAYKEELWDAPQGLAFYDAPNGRQIGALAKAATIRTFGAPLSPRGAEDWAWRAGLVQTAQVTGSPKALIVWFPRRQLTNARDYRPPEDCSDEVKATRAVTLERARAAALEAVGRAIDALAKEA